MTDGVQDIVARHEICERVTACKSTVKYWKRAKGFPEPIRVLAGCDLYSWTAVALWLSASGRRALILEGYWPWHCGGCGDELLRPATLCGFCAADARRELRGQLKHP